MTALPRILVLIGSGETAPQMTRGHRMLVERIVGPAGRPADVRAAVLDTPYRFQENAADLSAELLEYFGHRIGMSASVCSFGRADDDIVVREAAFECVRSAQFVFAGPGSPSYALRQWSESAMPGLFAEKLASGGVQVFASAAALTMGRLTVPVYEIYKAGDDAFWLSGLDVLGTIGINAAVVPHYDNGEGGGHDTRFCFLGEQRLRVLEELMPDDTYILGIDEHTALMLDLDAERALVHGLGAVTIRERGRSESHAAGTAMPLADLQRHAGPRPARRPEQPVTAAIAKDADLARRLLGLEHSLDRERSLSGLVEPMLSTLLDLRREARAKGDYAAADAIRDGLTQLGIELTDSADGTTSYRLPG